MDVCTVFTYLKQLIYNWGASPDMVYYPSSPFMIHGLQYCAVMFANPPFTIIKEMCQKKI